MHPLRNSTSEKYSLRVLGTTSWINFENILKVKEETLERELIEQSPYSHDIQNLIEKTSSNK